MASVVGRENCVRLVIVITPPTIHTAEDWYVSVATLVKGFDADPYFRRAEAEVWLPHDGKPHWGKLHYLGHVRGWACLPK